MVYAQLQVEDTIAVNVLQPRTQAIRLPVAWAAQFTLKGAGRHSDHGALVTGDPVGFVIIIKFYTGGAGEIERNVSAIGLRVGAVVFGPTVIECRFVRPTAGWYAKAALPDGVVGIIGKFTGDAFGLPIAGATKFTLQTAYQGDAGRVRSVVG